MNHWLRLISTGLAILVWSLASLDTRAHAVSVAPPHLSGLWAAGISERTARPEKPLMETRAANGASSSSSARPRAHVPKYMLELYESIEKVHHKSSVGDVVRSYSNMKQENNVKFYDNLLPKGNQESGSNTRIHTLVFNVTSLPEHEILEKAELRLFALIHRDQHTYLGVERQVTIASCQTTFQGEFDCEEITSKLVHETVSGWETFIVTPAVTHWLESGKLKGEQRLEVRISSIFSRPDGGELDFPIEPYSDTEPLLLIHSIDRRRTESSDDENREYENDDDIHNLRRRSADIEEAEEESNSILEVDNAPRVASGRNVNGRKRHKNPCRRRSLRVNFADINYDTWIIAPTEYEANECTGKCYFPLSDHLTPTKHAIVQTLLHTVSPKKTSRACCVPTKLKPISVLYVDADGVVTYKFHYDDMVVAECGCR